MSRHILLIAYHVPPIQVSSGYQRTVSYARYLSEKGWKVSVLTTATRAYPRINEDQRDLMPQEVEVIRAFALDTARHLSFKGRYPGLLALPDRWQSWVLGGVWSGLRLIRKNRPQMIVTTYPIATAHLIGFILHKLTKLPWIAEFRDPMAQAGYPADPLVWKCFKWVEEKAIYHAERIVLVTPGALRYYRQRYPELPGDKWAVIPNGYDEVAFARAEQDDEARPDGPIVLLHSGVLYPSERNPYPFFNAVAALKKAGRIDGARVQIVLRASGSEDQYRRYIADQDIGDIVRLAPSVDYISALREMTRVSGLILMQAANCNDQIPAKAYEYLRARKPVLVLTDPAGDTAGLFRSVGVGRIARLDSEQEIMEALGLFLEEVASAPDKVLSLEEVRRFSRHYRGEELLNLIETFPREPCPPPVRS